MKKIFRYILAAAVSTTMFAACNLDLVPNSAIAYSPAEPLIQTQANLNAFENGVLASFRSYQMGVYSYVEDVMMDGFNATIDYGNNYGAVHRTDADFNSSDYNTRDNWSGAYTVIKNYNILIANADNVPDDLKAKAHVVKGEAYFARAYAYIQLARHFGKAYGASSSTDLCVPLVLEYDQNGKPARATVADVYAAIKSDIDSAAVCLAGVKGSARAQKPTIDAVNALYARYYLDIKDYKNAATYAHKVIDTGTYKLASTADEMTDVFVDDKGSEAIMQMYCSLTEGRGSLAMYTQNTTENSVPSGYVYDPYYLPSKALVESYEASDLRLAAWYNNTNTARFAGVFHTGEFYVFTKYEGNPALTSTPIRNGSQAVKPFMLAEQYLIAAEAEAASGNAAAAKADLNALQAARGASTTTASTDNIQAEWFKETVGEGCRMTCLKRWGKGFSGRAAQTGATDVVQHGSAFDQKVFKADDVHFQWPVPASELKLNKNLVQNPGYDSK